MALHDLMRKVVTNYKADTSDHKKAIGELRKEVGYLSKEEEEAAKKRGKSLGDHVDGLKKVVGAIAGATIAFEGYKQVVEETRLATAAQGVDIEKLDNAAGGLKTRMELLGEAAKLNRSYFKLTGDQMVTVELAMRSLTRAGFDQAEVSDKVLESLVKLEGDGLKDFGVRVREATTDADKFKAIMEALAGEAKKVDPALATDAERMQKFGVEMSDSIDKMKKAIGEMVVALGPLISALASVVSVAADGVSKLSERAYISLTPEERKQLHAAGAANKQAARDAYRRALDGIPMDERGVPFVQGPADLPTDYRDSVAMQAMLAAWQRRPKGGKGGSSSSGDSSSIWEDDGTNALGDRFAAAIESFIAFADSEGAKQTSAFIQANAGNFAIGEDAAVNASIASQYAGIDAANANAYNEFVKGQQAGKLEQMFGPLSDFSGYTMAFQGLQGAVTSAMNAWIDGSKSAGEAVKAFFAESMKANATMMAAEALKEGAYAIGSLAIGDFAGASAHGLAALKFAGAAAVFAIGAKQLGGSGGGGGTGISSAPQTIGSAPQAGQRGAIVVIGNDFTEGSPRQRQVLAERLVEQAYGTGFATSSS